jgi:hypothetical protein
MMMLAVSTFVLVALICPPAGQRCETIAVQMSGSDMLATLARHWQPGARPEYAIEVPTGKIRRAIRVGNGFRLVEAQ